MYKYLFSGISLFFCHSFSSAQSKLILAKLTRTEKGITISNPINIGNNKGYDNQPSFCDEANNILFSSNADSVQMDIYKYNTTTKKLSAITKNKENEFSPLLTSNKENITCVKGKNQRLVIYDLNGKNEDTLFVHPDSIGYYNWIDNDRIAALVLTQPQSLQIINVKNKETTTVAKNIGRTILPYKDGFMFLKKADEQKNYNGIIFVEKNMRQSPMLPMLKENENFYCVNDTLFTVEHDTLKYTYIYEERRWTTICDLRSLGLKNVSRLVANERGNMIAFVAKEFVSPKIETETPSKNNMPKPTPSKALQQKTPKTKK